LSCRRVPTGPAAIRLSSFREKPDAATAEAFLSGGRHLWNAGLFLFRAADVIRAFEALAPDLLALPRGDRGRGRATSASSGWAPRPTLAPARSPSTSR
jgi:mannose-1-phosphate guanylyltransferase